jgi:GNAT superfamily N-acetyltransferase
MKLQVRAASPTDRSEISRLLDLAVSAGTKLRGGQEALALLPISLTSPEQRDALIDEGLLAEDHSIALGFIEDSCVGIGWLSLDQQGARVELIYVETEARTVGLGEEILNYQVALAKSQGKSWIDAVALPGDRSTKSLFERSGLIARQITLRSSLGE